MVQITHALVRDDETGELVKIAADKFDKKTDGKKTCHCPDENCPALLTHYQTHMHHYYDEVARKHYKLKIPDYFRVAGKSPPHAPSCTAVVAYSAYQNSARDLGGLSQQNGVFIYNLDVMTNTRPAPNRSRKVLSPEFRAAAPVRDNKSSSQNDNDGKKLKLSEGLNHVKGLAKLLDSTEFDRHYRDAILLRDGDRSYTLAGLFVDDTLALFRAEYTRAKKGDGDAPVLLQFKPIEIGRFHSKRDLTIQGLALPIKSVDGNKYYVSVKLHCGSEEIYKSVKENIRRGNNSFLLYTDKATVDIQECERTQSQVQKGEAKDRTVFVHVSVATPQQIMPWKPFDGQLDMEVAGMDLPFQHRPPRMMPPQPTI